MTTHIHDWHPLGTHGRGCACGVEEFEFSERDWAEATATIDLARTLDTTIEPLFRSKTLTEDERMGLAILLGLAPLHLMSYANVQAGTAAVEALAARAGLDVREFGRAYARWIETSR